MPRMAETFTWCHSVQVTFEHHAVGGCIVHVNGELLGSLKLPGIENSLVTNSFLGFGLDVAQEQVAQLVRKHRPSKVRGGPQRVRNLRTFVCTHG